MNSNRAFTLIELLVVVAIVAILAAIASVNFLESQARGKVAAAMSDMRIIEAGLAAYHVDAGAYPNAAIGDLTLENPLHALSTPVAYLSVIPDDVFGPASFDFAPNFNQSTYNYKDAATTSQGLPGETYGELWRDAPTKNYLIHSAGPNGVWDVSPYETYDPTNGTISRGDISILGP